MAIQGGKMDNQYFGLAEFAEVLGVKSNVLGNWMKRGVQEIPEPLVILKCGPVWSRTQILAYIDAKYWRAKERMGNGAT